MGIMECYFFGTFNPIHLGHVEIARKVKELAGFSRVIFVPSYMPPHKIEGLESYIHRLEMTKLAVGEDNVSDIERHLQVPSYTYRTIEKLYKKNNDQKVNFIIGYDQFFKLESWREPEILREKINFIVIPRKFQNGQVMGSQAFKYFQNKGYSFEVLRAKVLYGTNATKRPKFKRDMDFKRFDKLGLDNLYYEGFEVDLNELKTHLECNDNQ